MTVAPNCARPIAVALPNPELLPVTRQTLPRISGFVINVLHLYRHGYSTTATQAQCSQTFTSTSTTQFVDQSGQDPRAA